MTDDHVYVLRCCPPSMVTTNGFRWPESGPVECPEWDPTPECGHGLHGWLWGEGDVTVASGYDDPESRWLVVRVEADAVVNLHGKVKFPRGEVVYCGDRAAAAAEIIRHGARGAVIGATVTAGAYGTATAGSYGTATAGDCGTATAGYRGTATSGYRGTATSGYDGAATAGAYGAATAGAYGTATAGDYGIATSGYGGTATAGDGGTATAGERGTATAGERGEIRIRWYDGSRCRLAVGYVGEDGILPGVAYVVRGGKFVRKADAR